MKRPQQFPIARQSAGHAPPRRASSIRRTTSIDSRWPEGCGQPWIMTGLARDLLTTPDGGAEELDFSRFHIRTSSRREILEIESTPPHPGIAALTGVRAGGASRAKLRELVGGLRGTPLYQLLDDFAGASLVANWMWIRWTNEWMKSAANSVVASTAGKQGAMVDICSGFAQGASSLTPDGSVNMQIQSSATVGQLEHPDDHHSWHALPVQSGPEARRARRIDLWRQGPSIMVDSAFQDSCTTPEGGRAAVHEYRVYAEVEAESGTLVSIRAVPLILPFAECPGASGNVDRLVGQNVADLRECVPEILASTLGCTHLNDVLRALADIPSLARRLPVEIA